MDLIEPSDNFKMKKRSDEIIIAQILYICEEGALKTRVIYQANLNSSTVNRYLDWLIDKGMIIKSTKGSRAVFKTTYRGYELKDKINRLQTELGELLAALPSPSV
jgi:predicted transcriptional regulator